MSVLEDRVGSATQGRRPTSTATSDGFTRAIARYRLPLIVACALLATAALLGIAASGQSKNSLDPVSPSPEGSRALAQLLDAQGISLTRHDRVEDVVRISDSRSTLVVTHPERMSAAMRTRLMDAQAGRVVLIAPDEDLLKQFLPEASITTTSGQLTDEVAPQCALPEAIRAGSAQLAGATGISLQNRAGVSASCYSVSGVPTLVIVTRPGGQEIVVVGSGRPFTNEALAESGNASLATSLLGSTRTLNWWVASTVDPLSAGVGAGSASLTELLPAWTSWVLLQVAVALAIAVVWRSRRLGPVVQEPLPVVVRASEAVEGRGRLYEQTDAREHAARVLQLSAQERLRLSLGIPPGEGAGSIDALITSVSARSGRAPHEVRDLLIASQDPDNDTALRGYSAALDGLVSQVNRTLAAPVTIDLTGNSRPNFPPPNPREIRHS